MILGFEDYQIQGRQLAETSGFPFKLIHSHRFPDGESRIRVPTELPERVVICRSLNQPDSKLIELLLAVRTLREQGVQHITLLAPYLCYMRQDIAFNPGEAVSQHIVGNFLAELFDSVITVDPHLHRISRLDEAIPGIPAIALSAATTMGEFLKEHSQQPMIVGPDAESEQWVRAIAEPAGFDYAIASKHRLGDRQVEVQLPEKDFTDRNIVLVDDMISTGQTLIRVARKLKSCGVNNIDCLVTHALFTAEATSQLHHAGIRHIWSSDSINHPTNAVALAALLATAIKDHQ